MSIILRLPVCDCRYLYVLILHVLSPTSVQQELEGLDLGYSPMSLWLPGVLPRLCQSNILGLLLLCAVMVLVGNKTDLAEQREVSEEEARAFADR
jgi:hypothetical protein